MGNAKQIELSAAGKPPQVETPLAQRLGKEAWENLKRGDPKGFLVRARQAIAAGASPEAMNSFAWKLAATSIDELRDPREAEAWARLTIDRGGRLPVYLDTLAACLAGQGKFDAALELELEAIQRIVEENPAAFAARAVLYQAKKAYVEPPGKKKDP